MYVCVEFVWMMADLSKLTWPSLIGLWDMVRLQICCTLSYQCAQFTVQLHMPLGGVSPPCHVHYLQNLQ